MPWEDGASHPDTAPPAQRSPLARPAAGQRQGGQPRGECHCSPSCILCHARPPVLTHHGMSSNKDFIFCSQVQSQRLSLKLFLDTINISGGERGQCQQVADTPARPLPGVAAQGHGPCPVASSCRGRPRWEGEPGAAGPLLPAAGCPRDRRAFLQPPGSRAHLHLLEPLPL